MVPKYEIKVSVCKLTNSRIQRKNYRTNLTSCLPCRWLDIASGETLYRSGNRYAY